MLVSSILLITVLHFNSCGGIYCTWNLMQKSVPFPLYKVKSSCVLDHPVTRQQLVCTWCLVYHASQHTAGLCELYKHEMTLMRCFAFFSSHVCIHRPSFSCCVFVLQACSVSNAPKILLLFTWRSHKVFNTCRSCHNLLYALVVCGYSAWALISSRNIFL